ncbi:T9SS C-terminal target domain-containing protein [uncultured Pontibacter sp.]|uniref:T9SS C-terminal target domain-containing protein n=1 Tax=uncultured Pontibacter sp. TaxID=453356 RepID=UPI0026387897|nr:T9SS C-terminal target domain-containing protein [uncultured Pontibacter sp.]
MKTKLLISVLSLLLLLPILVQATHIKGAYISYTVDPQNPRNFNFTLTVYTNHSSPAEDPEAVMHMGDGNTVIVPRNTVAKYDKDYDIEHFHWTYTYNIPNHYTVVWAGENRNNSILNIPAPSDQVGFYTYTTVNVNPLSSNRHGINLAGLPLLEGVVGKPLRHNFAAYDADGDRIIYQLVAPKKEDAAGKLVDIAGYTLPEGLTLDEYGELIWDAPAVVGRYTIAIQTIEYRDGVVQGLGVADFEVTIVDKDKKPHLELLNKNQLSQNDDGSVKVMPGQPLKLEYFMRRHPDSNAPALPKLYSELDTLDLLPISIAIRDSADGHAITISFTPGEELVREQPYIVAMSAMAPEKANWSNGDLFAGTNWEFTYLYIGDAEPTASEDELKGAGFILYPNPVADQFAVEAPDMPGMFLHLLDAGGKKAGVLRLKPGKNTFTRPASLSAGLYFYTIYSRYKPVGSGKLVVR